MSKLAVSDATFDQAVLAAGKPVLVMTWQPGCSWCSKMVPELKEVAKILPDVHFTLLNVADNTKTKSRFEVTACPTLLLFGQGKLLGRWKGFNPSEKTTAWIKRTLEMG
jgi:thioredoxin 1